MCACVCAFAVSVPACVQVITSRRALVSSPGRPTSTGPAPYTPGPPSRSTGTPDYYDRTAASYSSRITTPASTGSGAKSEYLRYDSRTFVDIYLGNHTGF